MLLHLIRINILDYLYLDSGDGKGCVGVGRLVLLGVWGGEGGIGFGNGD